MIAIYTGKPGGGKTYGALLEILRELEQGDRDIVTNVALDLNVMNEYFQRRGRKFADVFLRVRIIDTREAREFWRFRGRFTVLPDSLLLRQSAFSTAADGSAASVSALAELVKDQPSVFYVIDEAHILFDARNWQKSSASLTFYNSQHRKLRDELVFVTQFLKLLEGRVRGFAEQFRVYRNFVGTKAFSLLSMPPRMRELVYSTEPGPGVDADSEAWRRLDAEKALCYDTSGGVGMTGGRKPEVRKVRGFALPWWSVIVAIVVLGVVMTQIPGWIARRIGTAIVGAPVKSALIAPDKAPAVAVSSPVEVAKKPGEGLGIPPKPKPLVTGVLQKGPLLRVTLDDGRTLRAGDVVAVYGDRVILRGGEVLFYARAVPVGKQSTKRAPG